MPPSAFPIPKQKTHNFPTGSTLAEGEISGHKHQLIGNGQVYVGMDYIRRARNPEAASLTHSINDINELWFKADDDLEIVHEEHKTLEIPKGIKLINPLGFFDFSKLEKNAFCLITDSGTIPEEALFFQKPCVTIRNTTERPEIIEAGSNILSGLSPDNILQSTQTITSKKPDWQWNKALGDGKTARKVLNILGGNLY